MPVEGAQPSEKKVVLFEGIAVMEIKKKQNMLIRTGKTRTGTFTSFVKVSLELRDTS